jgi:hypothetical protein
MSIVLPFAEKIVVEKVSGDILFPRTSGRKSKNKM